MCMDFLFWHLKAPYFLFAYQTMVISEHAKNLSQNAYIFNTIVPLWFVFIYLPKWRPMLEFLTFFCIMLRGFQPWQNEICSHLCVLHSIKTHQKLLKFKQGGWLHNEDDKDKYKGAQCRASQIHGDIVASNFHYCSRSPNQTVAIQ